MHLISEDKSDKGMGLAKIWTEEYNSLPYTMDDSERHLNATRATATTVTAARLLLDDRVEGHHFSSWYSTHIKTSQEASVGEEQPDERELSFFQRCSARLWATVDPALLDSLPEPSHAHRSNRCAACTSFSAYILYTTPTAPFRPVTAHVFSFLGAQNPCGLLACDGPLGHGSSTTPFL